MQENISINLQTPFQQNLNKNCTKCLQTFPANNEFFFKQLLQLQQIESRNKETNVNH